MKNLRFTRILPEMDLATVVKLLNESHGTVAKEFGFTRENNPTNNAFIDESTLRNQLNKGIELYVLAISGQNVGCIAIEKSSKDTSTFYIEKVSVLPIFRNHKYGVELMNLAISKINEYGGKTASLALIDSNVKLKNWYLSQGFIETTTKDFEHLPFKVCFMSKNI